MRAEGDGPSSVLTLWQRRSLNRLVRQARKTAGQPLSSPEWEAYFAFSAQPRTRAMKRLLRALPSTPRCGYCGAPFAGLGGRLVRPLGYRPSRKNPSICATCVELAPPGGTTVEAGVLFADLRGFTAQTETSGAAHAGGVLREFYAHAEAVLFPEALIDKVVGDQVMALYLPVVLKPGSGGSPGDEGRREIADLMLRHAHELLHRVGYGSAGPTLELGIGLDFGEVFIGNIGDRGLRDFTAVGDVVNTAARLESLAAGGEVLVSERLGQYASQPLGDPESLELKGKAAPVQAHRVRWFASSPG